MLPSRFTIRMNSSSIAPSWMVSSLFQLHKKGSLFEAFRHPSTNQKTIISRIMIRIVKDSIIDYLSASNPAYTRKSAP